MEKEYKKVLEKYAGADLYAMSEEEYAELKEAEMADMQSYVDAITDSNVPEVMYRIGRAVTDLKYLLESSADIWGGQVLYHQIMPGDYIEIPKSHYESFKDFTLFLASLLTVISSAFIIYVNYK